MAEAFAQGETIALRPGLRLPDWSVVEDAEGHAALAANMEVAGRRRKWAGLDAEEDAARRAVLRLFASHGPGPSVAEVAAETSLPEAAALAALHGLHHRDLLLLDAGRTRVAACYPFSAAPTRHCVAVGEARRILHALCAIDALGIGGMLRAETGIRSRCAQCEAEIVIRLSADGRGLQSVEPRETVVWSSIAYSGGCSATSGCTLKNFFCSEEHLQAWRVRATPAGPGFRLSVEVARQVGLALFGPMLSGGAAHSRRSA